MNIKEINFLPSSLIKQFNLKTLIVVLVFSLPLSIKVYFNSLKTEIIYPGELLIAITVLLYFFYLTIKRIKKIKNDFAFFSHPITLVVIMYLLTNFMSTYFSTMSLVSVKAFIVKLSYILSFYFFLHYILKISITNYLQLIKIYGLSLLIVIFYTFINQSKIGFTRKGASFASNPFFNDHTIFGAAIVFILPVFILLCHFGFARKKTLSTIGYWFLCLLFLVSIYLSFCRAAWISLTMMFFLYLIILFRIKFRYLILLLTLFLTIGIFNRSTIIDRLKANKADSNAKDVTIREQLNSFTNITNDVSNKERLNRWFCSLRMFKEKPILGFGPGTFQFQYIDFQIPSEMTYISAKKYLEPGSASYSWSQKKGVTIDQYYSIAQGSGGSTHSEYFLELAEGGIISLLCFILLFFLTSFYCIKHIYNVEKGLSRLILICSQLSLTGYFIHGLFNNFLDDCKISFLFWVSICVVTTIDLKINRNKSRVK